MSEIYLGTLVILLAAMLVARNGDLDWDPENDFVCA